MSVNDKILSKIKNLLSLAEDGANDEESQTALLMAQKLMLKYKVSQNQLEDQDKEQKIVIKSLSVYKRLYWWEKILVKIIAENFRVMFYVQSNKLPHQKSIQRKLVLMGYPQDVELAHEIFHLVANTMKHYASLYIQGQEPRPGVSTAKLRKSYYQGFMDGLDDKFEKQREALRQKDAQYALALQTPSEVMEKFNREIKGSLAFEKPVPHKAAQSYLDGYDRGKRVNLNQKGIEG